MAASGPVSVDALGFVGVLAADGARTALSVPSSPVVLMSRTPATTITDASARGTNRRTGERYARAAPITARSARAARSRATSVGRADSSAEKTSAPGGAVHPCASSTRDELHHAGVAVAGEQPAGDRLGDGVVGGLGRGVAQLEGGDPLRGDVDETVE